MGRCQSRWPRLPRLWRTPVGMLPPTSTAAQCPGPRAGHGKACRRGKPGRRARAAVGTPAAALRRRTVAPKRRRARARLQREPGGPSLEHCTPTKAQNLVMYALSMYALSAGHSGMRVSKCGPRGASRPYISSPLTVCICSNGRDLACRVAALPPAYCAGSNIRHPKPST